MILDSSVIVAIILEEGDAALYEQAISRSNLCRVAAPGYVETSLVISRSPNIPDNALDVFLEAGGIRIEAFTAEHARLARAAHQRYGRGNHPAKLNYGDCMAYALAKALDEPLLYKGGDFAQTDVISALD